MSSLVLIIGLIYVVSAMTCLVIVVETNRAYKADLMKESLKVPPEIEDLVRREAEAVAYALPAHMLTLMFLECQKKGWQLRMDVFEKLNKSAGVPLTGFDPFTIRRLAIKIDEHANALLHDLSPDDPVDGLHTVAMFVLILIDEALLGDPRAVVVVTSLLLMEDIKVGNEDWPFKEKFLRDQARKLLHRATFRGLYQTRMRDKPISLDG